MKDHMYMKWFAGTDSIYWHDTAIDRECREAMENGAVGMTTNPFLMQATLKNDRAFWEKDLAQLPKDLVGDEKAEALCEIVIRHYAEVFRPLYEAGKPYEGIICVQLNPLKSGDAAYMIEQGKRFASWAPNVMLKIPATNAGIKAIEELTALGIHVTSTVTLTVPQIMAAARAEKRGKERALAAGIKPGLTCIVMQPGRLDDYLRDTAQDCESGITEEDIVRAGLACSRKAYRLLKEGGYDSLLLFAGFRSTTQITEMAGVKAVFTVPTAFSERIPADAAQEEHVEDEVPAEVIERLMNLPEFRKAYLEDGMAPEEFIAYGAFNRTIDQLINDGWNELLTYKY